LREVSVCFPVSEKKAQVELLSLDRSEVEFLENRVFHGGVEKLGQILLQWILIVCTNNHLDAPKALIFSIYLFSVCVTLRKVPSVYL